MEQCTILLLILQPLFDADCHWETVKAYKGVNNLMLLPGTGLLVLRHLGAWRYSPHIRRTGQEIMCRIATHARMPDFIKALLHIP